jgi:integrase
MFNDAASAPAGTLVDRNPFANLRLPGSRGRKDVQPPTGSVSAIVRMWSCLGALITFVFGHDFSSTRIVSPHEAEIARFVALADELTPPSLAAYLDVAVHSGMRPGEFDALRWSKLDFQSISRQPVSASIQRCERPRTRLHRRAGVSKRRFEAAWAIAAPPRSSIALVTRASPRAHDWAHDHGRRPRHGGRAPTDSLAEGVLAPAAIILTQRAGRSSVTQRRPSSANASSAVWARSCAGRNRSRSGSADPQRCPFRSRSAMSFVSTTQTTRAKKHWSS